MAQNIGSLEVDLSINSNTQQGTDEAKKDLEKVQKAAETLSETFDKTAKTTENAANKMQAATNALADGIGETTSAIDGLNVSTDESVEKLYALTVQMLEMVKNGEEQTEQYAEIKESIEDLLSAHQELRENPPFSQEQYETLREYQDGLQAIAETTENVAAQTAEVDLSSLRDEMQHLIPIQEKALQQLSKIYDENTAHIKALEEEIAQISESEQNTEKIENLNAELEARKALNEEVEATKQAFESANIQQQLKAVKIAMQNLYAAGKEDTEMYKELMQEAGRLADIKGDVAAQTAILANDEANIKATTDALGGVNSALSTAETGMSMLGISSTQLTKVMTDLNSVQKIFNGLATVSAVLNQDSYARRIATITATKVQTSVTNLLTKAHLSEAAAAKVATVATAAATAGLTLLIPVLYSIISKFRELSQAQEEVHTAMAEAAAPAIVAVEKLSAKWDKLGDNLDEKRKFIAENSDEFKNLGANVQSVADAEALLSDGASKFIQSLMAKAKAAAAYNLIVEKQKELIEAQLTYGGKKVNGDYEGDTGFHFWTEGGVNALFSDEAAQQGNKAHLKKVTEEINEIIKNYKGIAKDAEEEIEKISKELGNALLPDEQTQSLIQNIKNAKTVFDNYRASLDSQNEGVKSYYAKQLKEFQERQGTAATTYKAYLQELKKNPLYNSKDSVLSVINEGILNDKSDPIKELIERRKKQYAEYSKLQNSTSAEIRSEADKQYSALIRQGANYEEYLKNLREKYKGNLAALKKINLELIETERQGMMDLFKTDFEKQMTFAKNAAEQLKVIAETRAAITDTDPQKREKNAVLDDKIKSISTSSTNDLANAQKSYSDYLTSLLPETVRYQREVQRLRLQFERETDDKAAEILFNKMQAAEIRLQMAQNKEKIDNAKSLADQLVQIEIKRQQDIAAIDADESLTKKQKANMTTDVNAFAEADIKMLKGQFADVDKNFVEKILAMTKEAAAGQLGIFIDTINDIQAQIIAMQQAGDTDSQQFVKLQAQLEITKNAYAAFQTKAKSATQKETKEIKKLGQAFQNLGGSLQEVGEHFTGLVGDIMKVTGQMFISASSIINSIQSLTTGVMEGLKGSATAAAAAIRTVETASVILAVIEAAMQVAMAIINAFEKNKETYEDRKQVYDAYISTVDTLIERERKLTETLSAQDAALSFGKIEKYYQDKIKVERQAAKDYLSSGAKWNEHSEGYKLNEKLTARDWLNIDKAIGTYGTGKRKKEGGRGSGVAGAPDLYGQVMADLGNLYDNASALLDLPAEKLKKIQEEAYETYAKLPQEMRDAIEAIIEADEAVMQLKDDIREQATGTSRESFVDSFKESLFDLDITAEKVSQNINEYLRKALILDLYKKDYQDQINEYYSQWGDAMADGIFTDDEEKALNELETKITNGLEEKINAINERFNGASEETEGGLSGAIKNASQESIDLLAGQTNAVRMNQVEGMALARESLDAVMAIHVQVTLCAQYLNSINAAVNSPGSDRARGII